MRVVSAAQIINTACATCQESSCAIASHGHGGQAPAPCGVWLGLWAAEQLPGVTEGIPALKKQMQGLKMEFCHAVLELTPERSSSPLAVLG